MYITKNGKAILSAMVAMFMVFGGIGLFAVSVDAGEGGSESGEGFETLVINFEERNVNETISMTAKWTEDGKWVLEKVDGKDAELPVPKNRFIISAGSVLETYWIFGGTPITNIDGLMEVMGEITGTPGGEATEVITVFSTQKTAENSEDFMYFYNLGVIDTIVDQENALKAQYQLGYQKGLAEVEVDNNEVLYGCLAIIFGVLTFIQFVILLKAFDKGKKDGRKIL